MDSKYEVYITRSAYNNLKQIRDYIALDLCAPDAAKKLLSLFQKQIGTLKVNPKRHPLIDEEKWKRIGIRKMIIKNYYIYYWVDEKFQRVNVIGIIYNRRDQLASILNMDLE